MELDIKADPCLDLGAPHPHSQARQAAQGASMIGAARRPIKGTFRSWSDGHRVHLLVRCTGDELGRGPVSMHTTTELVPAREAVIGYYRDRDADIAGDPVHVEALATRVGRPRRALQHPRFDGWRAV